MKNSTTTRRVILISGLAISVAIGATAFISGLTGMMQWTMAILGTLFPTLLGFFIAGVILSDETKTEMGGWLETARKEANVLKERAVNAERETELARKRTPSPDELIAERDKALSDMFDMKRQRDAGDYQITQLKALGRMVGEIIKLQNQGEGSSQRGMTTVNVSDHRMIELHALINECVQLHNEGYAVQAVGMTKALQIGGAEQSMVETSTEVLAIDNVPTSHTLQRILKLASTLQFHYYKD